MWVERNICKYEINKELASGVNILKHAYVFTDFTSMKRYEEYGTGPLQKTVMEKINAIRSLHSRCLLATRIWYSLRINQPICCGVAVSFYGHHTDMDVRFCLSHYEQHHQTQVARSSTALWPWLIKAEDPKKKCSPIFQKWNMERPTNQSVENSLNKQYIFC